MEDETNLSCHRLILKYSKPKILAQPLTMYCFFLAYKYKIADM